MEPTLSVNAPAVVGEIIDGEAVIMDLTAGHYFSSQGAGCEIWRGVERGLTRSAIVESLLERYDAPREVIEPAVYTFVAELLTRKLVVESAGEAPAIVTSPEDGARDRTAFVPPVLTVYEDMADLLLLDPIHDVDEAGWPMPKAADTGT
ncbi:MAG TPA: PqqD family protein [Gemmatimonadaceae bacterium]|nr:PqqD family protein [Gemmatimonadaceae bacterium]